MKRCHKKIGVRVPHMVRSHDGMTLVEVVLAIVIIGAVAVGGGAMITYSKRVMVEQKYKRSAIAYANSRMEEVVKGWPYSSALALVGAPVGTNITLNQSSSVFAMTTTVVQAGVAADGCLRVSVSIDRATAPKVSIVLRTYRSQ